MVALIKTHHKAISMIHFVRGRKEPAKQKGIAVRKRKKLRVQIRPGSTVTLKKSFIAQANKAVQVFRRRPSGKLAKRRTFSLKTFLEKKEVMSHLLEFGQKRYLKEFERNFKFYLGKIKKR